MEKRKRINTSNSSFEKLITSNALYIDKTRYIYELISDIGGYYFCARPRRFGKTLMLYTLEALFQGKKDLFKGLYVSKTDYDFKQYPVIHIDFGVIENSTPETLKSSLTKTLINIGNSYNIKINNDNQLKDMLSFLVKELYKKYGDVVVLIDEYDKPISDNIYNTEVEDIRALLRGFFEVLKASPSYLRFVFIIGVTKYSNMSIFSSMNNLKDISMDEQYATMFGYTQSELEENFNEYIEEGIKATGLKRDDYLKTVKEKYDGYCFYPDTETVYNPISINNFFFDRGKIFKSYWVETGQSNLITNIAKEVDFNIDSSLVKPISPSRISSFDIVEMAKTKISLNSYKAFLFQSGYLTITEKSDYESLFLDYPNREVQEAFSLLLVKKVYLDDDEEGIFEVEDAREAIKNGETESLLNQIKTIYASIPYHEYIGNQNEAHYHSIFHSVMLAVGANINSELATNKGRIDTIVKAKNHIYIFEFKLDTLANVALEQIKAMGYDEQFKEWNKEGKTVHIVGISFSSTEKNITDWTEEIIK